MQKSLMRHLSTQGHSQRPKFSAVAAACATLTTSTMGTDMRRPIITVSTGPSYLPRDNYSHVHTQAANWSRSDRVRADNYIVPRRDTILITFPERYPFHRRGGSTTTGISRSTTLADWFWYYFRVVCRLFSCLFISLIRISGFSLFSLWFCWMSCEMTLMYIMCNIVRN